MADIITVQVKLDARQATAQLKKFQSATAGATGMGSPGRAGGASQQIQKTNKSLNRSINLLRIYAGAWIAANAAMSALREVGTVQNMERAIITVTEGSQQLNDTWDRLRETSLATRSDFESNVILFQRLTFATKNLGTTTEEVEDSVAAIAAGMRLGGATAQESASATRQLSQAFSKGKLDGDEFRSVMENAGFLMVRFADQIGVTVGELREMSRNGEITSQVMIDGFSKVRQIMEDELARAPRTVDDAINDLRTTWLEFIRAGESSGAFVAAIDLIVKALEIATVAINEFSAAWEGAQNVLSRFGIGEAQTLNEALNQQVIKSRELIKAQNDLETASGRNRAAAQNRVNMLKKQVDAINELVTKMTEQKEAVANIARDQERGRSEAQREKERLEAEKKANEEREKRIKIFEEEQKWMRQAESDLKKLVDAEQKQRDEKKKADEEAIESERKRREEREKFLTEQIGIGTEPNNVIEKRKNQLQQYAESLMTTEDVFVGALKGMEDALVEFVMTGKLDFSSLIDSMIADIARLAIQQAVTKPLANSLAGLFGPTTVQPETSPIPQSGAGGFLGSAFNAIKGFLPGFQDGGSFMVGGKPGIDKNLVAFRASKGEQVNIMPKGQSAGVNIVMNIQTQDAESFGRNQDQMMNALQARLAAAQRNL